MSPASDSTCWSARRGSGAVDSTLFSSAIEMTAATSETKAGRRLRLPSVHAVLDTAEAGLAVERFGRSSLVAAVRAALAAARTAGAAFSGDAGSIAVQAVRQLETQAQSSLRPVFNLTGTVLHTNLGRALLAETAIAAAVAAMR